MYVCACGVWYACVLMSVFVCCECMSTCMHVYGDNCVQVRMCIQVHMCMCVRVHMHACVHAGLVTECDICTLHVCAHQQECDICVRVSVRQCNICPACVVTSMQ